MLVALSCGKLRRGVRYVYVNLPASFSMNADRRPSDIDRKTDDVREPGRHRKACRKVLTLC